MSGNETTVQGFFKNAWKRIVNPPPAPTGQQGTRTQSETAASSSSSTKPRTASSGQKHGPTTKKTNRVQPKEPDMEHVDYETHTLTSSAYDTFHYFYSKLQHHVDDPVNDFKKHWFDFRKEMEELMISGSELQQASIEDRKRLLTKPNEYSRNLIRTLERASRKESLGDGQHSSTYMAKIEDFVWEQEVLARVSDFGIKDVPMGARQIALKLLATLLQFIGPNVLQLQHARQQLGTLMRRTFEHYRSRTTYHKLLSCQEKNTGDGNFCVWLEDTLASQANRQTNRSFYWLTRTASVLLIHLIDSTTKLAPFFLSEGSSPKEGSVEESRTVSLELIFEILKHGWLEQTKDSLDVGALAREALVMALESQVEPVIVCLARDEKWYRDINMVMSWLWKCVRYNSVKHAAHSVKLLEMLIHFYDCITLDDSSQTNATLCDVQMKLKAQFTHFVDEHVVSNFGKAEQRNECILLLKVLDCLESSQGSRKLTLPFLRTCICRAVGGMRDTTAIETILALCKSENYFDTMTGMELIASLLRAGDLRSCELLLGGLPNHKTRPQVKDKLQSLEATLENKLKEWWQVSELTIDTSFIAAEAEKHLLGSLLADVDEENTEACTKTDEECRISQLVISKLLKLFKMQSGEHTIVSSIIAAMFSVPRFYGVDSLLSAEVSVPNKRDKSFTFEGVMQELWNDSIKRAKRIEKRHLQAALHDARNEQGVSTVEEVEPLTESEIPKVITVQKNNEEFFKSLVALEQLTIQTRILASMSLTLLEIV